ncbi:MAG: DUF3109 family protein [Prevotellaceae bacterium]|nr:DUF3109 family protein [Prevotellaceae bacterium]
MVQIDDKLISADLWQQYFACDLAQCAGICCVYGDSGAPLEPAEVEILKKEYPRFVAYMKPEGVKAVEKQGVAVVDFENELSTPLIANRECAYSCFDKENICYCAIERACREGKTTFRKPISCWLYPVRLQRLKENIGLNYDRQHLCGAAQAKGREENMPVFRFLREPLIYRFGKEFYEAMEKMSEEFKDLKI